jgi:hypothetical protein
LQPHRRPTPSTAPCTLHLICGSDIHDGVRAAGWVGGVRIAAGEPDWRWDEQTEKVLRL